MSPVEPLEPSEKTTFSLLHIHIRRNGDIIFLLPPRQIAALLNVSVVLFCLLLHFFPSYCFRILFGRRVRGQAGKTVRNMIRIRQEKHWHLYLQLQWVKNRFRDRTNKETIKNRYFKRFIRKLFERWKRSNGKRTETSKKFESLIEPQETSLSDSWKIDRGAENCSKDANYIYPSLKVANFDPQDVSERLDSFFAQPQCCFVQPSNKHLRVLCFETFSLKLLFYFFDLFLYDFRFLCYISLLLNITVTRVFSNWSFYEYLNQKNVQLFSASGADRRWAELSSPDTSQKFRQRNEQVYRGTLCFSVLVSTVPPIFRRKTVDRTQKRGGNKSVL